MNISVILCTLVNQTVSEKEYAVIWNPEIESSDRKIPIEAAEEPCKAYPHCLRLCAFYREKFDRAGVRPEDIQSLDDIRRLPFTTKDDLRLTYPYGLLAVDESEIVEIHTSSGTTGTPVVGAYTAKDIETWAEAMARCLCMAGAGRGDVIQNAYGYGLFTGGLGVHYGARRIGANVIPASAGNTQKQLLIMKDFGTTVLTCTPSYGLFLAEAALEMGFDFKKFNLKAGIFGAEPWSEQMRVEIERRLNLHAFDIYGLTEIIGPGLQTSAQRKRSSHKRRHVLSGNH